MDTTDARKYLIVFPANAKTPPPATDPALYPVNGKAEEFTAAHDAVARQKFTKMCHNRNLSPEDCQLFRRIF